MVGVSVQPVLKLDMMKFALALVAVLAVFGLGQAHQVPDFGSGPLHEDLQDILDLVPAKEINAIVEDYIYSDPEVQAAIQYILNTPLLKNLMTDIEAIPEVIKLLNYLQKEGIYAYELVNEINKALGIKEIKPSTFHLNQPAVMRTGGVAGLVKDIKNVISYDKFIRVYVQKLQTSTAFQNFIKQLKSDNFQKIVNKLFKSESFMFIVKNLKSSGVNLQLVADLMYIVLGTTVPKNNVSLYSSDELIEELSDFFELIPIEKFISIFENYYENDVKVQKAFDFILSEEFDSMLKKVQALDEYKKLFAFLQKAIEGNVLEHIQELRELSMKAYDSYYYKFEVMKVGDGLNSMLDDLAATLPHDKIQALYQQKMKTSKVFSDFVTKVTSAEAKKLFHALYNHPTFQQLVAKSLSNGVDFKAIRAFGRKIVPIPEI